MAKYIANNWSKDQSTKVSAIIVNLRTNEIVSSGVNGFPRGFNDTSLYEDIKEEKYTKVIHAEMNAILHLIGKSFHYHDEHGIYLTHHPCSNCAKHIAQVSTLIKLTKLFYFVDRDFEKRYHDDCLLSRSILRESGIEVIAV